MQSNMAALSSHSGMPRISVVPLHSAAIASCRKAMDLLPGSVTSASNPDVSFSTLKGVASIDEEVLSSGLRIAGNVMKKRAEK